MESPERQRSFRLRLRAAAFLASALSLKGHVVRSLAEVPLLAAVASLILLFVCLPLKRPVDGVLFAIRSTYRDMTYVSPASPARGRIVVDVRRGVTVGVPTSSGSTFVRGRRVELQMVPSLTQYEHRFLGRNVIAPASGRGVLLDEDTARAVHVSRGGIAVIVVNDTRPGHPTVGIVPVRIRGILHPYPSPQHSDANGLLV